MADAKRCDRCESFYMADDIKMYGIKKNNSSRVYWHRRKH